jgi:hypothetical protein
MCIFFFLFCFFVQVLQNLGIFYRRTQEWSRSLWFFQRALAVDPQFCEPHYWIALTYLNSGIDDEKALADATLELQRLSGKVHGDAGHHSPQDQLQLVRQMGERKAAFERYQRKLDAAVLRLRISLTCAHSRSNAANALQQVKA